MDVFHTPPTGHKVELEEGPKEEEITMGPAWGPAWGPSQNLALQFKGGVDQTTIFHDLYIMVIDHANILLKNWLVMNKYIFHPYFYSLETHHSLFTKFCSENTMSLKRKRMSTNTSACVGEDRASMESSCLGHVGQCSQIGSVTRAPGQKDTQIWLNIS